MLHTLWLTGGISPKESSNKFGFDICWLCLDIGSPDKNDELCNAEFEVGCCWCDENDGLDNCRFRRIECWWLSFDCSFIFVKSLVIWICSGIAEELATRKDGLSPPLFRNSWSWNSIFVLLFWVLSGLYLHLDCRSDFWGGCTTGKSFFWKLVPLQRT